MSEAAIYPGELPRNPEAVFRDEPRTVKQEEIDYRFVRFRPPPRSGPRMALCSRLPIYGSTERFSSSLATGLANPSTDRALMIDQLSASLIRESENAMVKD